MEDRGRTWIDASGEFRMRATSGRPIYSTVDNANNNTLACQSKIERFLCSDQPKTVISVEFWDVREINHSVGTWRTRTIPDVFCGAKGRTGSVDLTAPVTCTDRCCQPDCICKLGCNRQGLFLDGDRSEGRDPGVFINGCQKRRLSLSVGEVQRINKRLGHPFHAHA